MLTLISLSIILIFNFVGNGVLFHLFYNWLLISVAGVDLPSISFFWCCMIGVVVSAFLD